MAHAPGRTDGDRPAGVAGVPPGPLGGAGERVEPRQARLATAEGVSLRQSRPHSQSMQTTPNEKACRKRHFARGWPACSSRTTSIMYPLLLFIVRKVVWWNKAGYTIADLLVPCRHDL
jgi:hypothetical protein